MSGGPFASLGVSRAGMDVYQTWLDAVADNLANINTVRRTDEAAFQARFVRAAARPGPGGGIGTGAAVTGVVFGNPLGRVVFDPHHPLADEQGFVRTPDIDLSQQMTHLIIAQRAYQANVTAFERARDAYQQALEIGR